MGTQTYALISFGDPMNCCATMAQSALYQPILSARATREGPRFRIFATPMDSFIQQKSE
jgi:hypothetical protein